MASPLAFDRSKILFGLQTSCLSLDAVAMRCVVPFSSLGPSSNERGVQLLVPWAEAQRIAGSSQSGHRHCPNSSMVALSGSD